MFLHALSGLTSERQHAVRACLTAWAADPHLAPVKGNIEGEIALPAAAFVALLEAFADRLIAGTLRPEAWELSCRSFQRAGAVHPEPPDVLGRAMPEEDYVGLVHAKNAALGVDRSRAERLVNQAVTLGPLMLAASVRALRRADLGKYLIWATFDPVDGARSPFATFPEDRWVIANALGLGGEGDTWAPATLLLLTYRRPEDLKVHRPTVSDAAAYRWYRPHADPGAHHGMTAPVHADLPPHVGMAEVVHAVIDGSTLMFPIRRAG